MKFRFTLLYLAFIFTSTSSFATHVAGGYIYYEYVQDSVFDFYVVIYRDCKGVPLSNPSSATRIHCPTGSDTVAVSLTKKSIREVTFACKSATQKCNPTNTTATGAGLEEHIYTTRIDFRKPPYNKLVSCGDLIFETGQCCRSSAMTTGLANSYFYINTTFDPGKFPTNTSPKFNHPPRFYVCCNKPVYLDFGAQDVDGDSLSYGLVYPKTSPTSNANYSSGYSNYDPVDTYNPKGGSTNPNANPPVGFYLNPESGMLIFTPTKCDNISSMAVEVKEWRKDSTGTPQLVGISIRESSLFLKVCSDNNLPSVGVSEKYEVCEGDSISIKITSSDKVFVPPPPLPSPAPDTVRLSYHGFIDGAIFRTNNDTARFQSGNFHWSPNSGSARSAPYTFAVTATDNHCDYPGSFSSFVKVYVVKQPSTDITKSMIQCGEFYLKPTDSTVAANASHTWSVLSQSGKEISDTSVVQFYSNAGTSSAQKGDTLRIVKSGTYIIKLTSTIGSCQSSAYDTLFSSGNFTLLDIPDLTFCKADTFEISFDTNIQRNLVNHEWYFNGDTLRNQPFRNALESGKHLLKIRAASKDGCIREDFTYLNTIYAPELMPISDTNFCSPAKRTFTAIDVKDSGLVTNRFLWNTGDIDSFLLVDKSGNYEVRCSNQCGADSVSFMVVVDSTLNPDLGKDQFLCDQDSVFIGFVNGKVGTKYTWNNGDSAAGIYTSINDLFILKTSNSCGTWSDSVEVFLDKSPTFPWSDTITNCDADNVWISIDHDGAEYIWSDGSTNDSLKIQNDGEYSLEVRSKYCGSESDTFYVAFEESPVVDLGPDTMINKPFSLELDAGTSNGSFIWSTGENSRKITVKDFSTYWVEVSNDCGKKRDSIQVGDLSGFESITRTKIRIYPNPGKGEFYVLCKEQPTSMQVRSSTGQEINADISGTSNGFVINLNNEVDGIYLLSIATAESVFMARLVLMR